MSAGTGSNIDELRLKADLQGSTEPPPARPMIEFLSPSQVSAYSPPDNLVLVGQNHIVRGSVFVIGGAPGVGKSRAAVALGVAGASRQPWFGLEVHRQFKTLIIQNENGRLRLKDEFAALDCTSLEAHVRISPPPPFGFAFDHPDFRAALAAEIESFSPEVVLIDPWNAAARDDKASDYLATFKTIREVVPAGDEGPALGIVAHTRKPKSDERAVGRSLLNLIAGSYVLGSVPRAVFILQAASDDPEDDETVWTCCKNNDGPMGEPSAWRRRNGLFEEAADFDWKSFYGSEKVRRGVQETDMEALFDCGRNKLELKHAAKELEEFTGACRAACYNALKLDGRFGHRLSEMGGFLIWK